MMISYFDPVSVIHYLSRLYSSMMSTPMVAALFASGCSLPFLSSSTNSAVACGPGLHRILSLGKWRVSSCSLETER